MARIATQALLVVLAVAALLLSPSVGADTPVNYNIVKGASVSLDGKSLADAHVFLREDKLFFLVCVATDANTYKVDRKGKKVSTLKRSSVMVKADKCRTIEGSKEMPMKGHLYAETATGFTFNDLAGHKVGVTIPEGMKR